ncbi:MAG: DNA polymerase III subunit alpha [Porphyromonas sp.]|nr:DNA polymerase III subunit alpha [Porphyromonas sp.]
MIPYTHLHVHSQYSLLDGQASIAGIVDKAMSDGMRAIALTDHGSMFGVKEFYNYIKKKNGSTQSAIKDCRKALMELEALESPSESDAEAIIVKQAELKALEAKLFKPIIGCEVYCARRHRTLKDKDMPDPYRPGRSIDYSGYHLVLLAKNKVGYQNLIKMVSYGWTEGFYHKPRIDKELLERYHEGIIVSSACLGGEVPQHILNGRIDEAESTIEWFRSIFGEDYYLELQRHKTDKPNANTEVYEEQERVNGILVELAAKHGVKIVATNDSHFVNEEDGEAHDRLICLSTNKLVNDPKRMHYSKQEWIKTQAEMNAIFSDIPEALANTQEIVDKVELYSIDHEPLMPDFPIPEGFADDDDYLRHLTYLGAERKYGEALDDEIRERIDFELETIKKMGFPGYFLIVQDFIAAARSMGVFVGPGRGSAAGSAVAYCLGITDIDPIKYDLLFERFLNPDRISMPDIDIDFDDDGRADVLRWVTDKYGAERVAHIITYGTMATKSSIKDIARVYGVDIPTSNRLAKLVPDKIEGVKKVTLAEAIKHVPELGKAAVGTDNLVRETLKYAQLLEGNIRNTGVHACGIIIGKTDISDVVPISAVEDKVTKEKLLVTQYEGAVIEETGLIKMDFLGLKTLSIIKEALENVKRRHGIEVDIDRIPLDDPKTYELYSQGRTVGTFQFESAGMQKYLRELKPTAFEDLIAMNALYRPGPMEYIPDFIARKHGRSAITYDLPCMERYLRDTYGITVYQEQVMLLSREIADFTRGQSDELRKAMGKKLADKMEALKLKFLDGGKKNGYDATVLEKIWADWAKFASYAFNKSHATCYSWVAYQTAYLKANYPSEYLAGALSRNLNNITEVTKLMEEARALGIKVLGPDVNESEAKFSVNARGDIRFGLSAVKNVGGSVVESILNARAEGGSFVDVYDFFERLDYSAVNSKALDSLILSGCLDTFGVQRELYHDLAPGARAEDTFVSSLIRYGRGVQEDRHRNENSLFGIEDEGMQIPRPAVPTHEPATGDLDRLSKEKELVGLYLSANPLAPYRMLLTYHCSLNTESLVERLEEQQRGSYVLGGMITKVFEGRTKSGNLYGRLMLEDYQGSYEFAIFGDKYLELKSFINKDSLVLIYGDIEGRPFRPDEYEFNIKRIVEMTETMQDNSLSEMQMTIPVELIDEALMYDLEQTLANNKGNSRLYIRLLDEQGRIGATLEYTKHGVRPTTALLTYCEQHGYEMVAK